ncbi:cytochrome c oxidase assembly factor 8-like [Saccostrea cucullata]|uniref:cytochrome c oxidase assembly factor 8-like n=1 Tax=Saccostrea cuccullata TaxID=36930 RepID=UPI002ED27D9A
MNLLQLRQLCLVNSLASNLNKSPNFIQCRSVHNQVNSELHIHNVPPPNRSHDLIGPPDKKSNLRPVVFHVPNKETPLQRRYRLLRKETHDWNQGFWASHNEKFFKEKEEFVKRKLREKRGELDSPESKLSAEELSEFYKNFLDKNFVLHASYNREWYKRNLRLLLPAFQVFSEKIYNKVFKR